MRANQPGLSKQLKDELGFLLFQRKGRSLEAVTPAGKDVLARARRVLVEAGNIRAYAANERGEKQGRLTLVSTAGDVPPGGLAVPLYRWRRVALVPASHELAALGRARTLAELAPLPLVSCESTDKPESSLRRGPEPHLRA